METNLFVYIISHITIKGYRRLGNFRVTFFHIRNFRAFNFPRLSNWRKIFNGENFPIYSTKQKPLVHFMLTKYIFCGQ